MPTQLASLRAYVASQPAARDGARAAAGDGPTIVVVGSGKGGSGTSVVAAMLALSAAAQERRVLLVDVDEYVGPQRFLLGVEAPHGLAALRAGLEPAALLVPVSATLTLLPGGPGAQASHASDAAAPLPGAERRALLRRVAALFGDYDLVVVDGGSRLDTVRAALDAAGAATSGSAERAPARLLVVSGTEPIALAASHALVKALVPPHVDGADAASPDVSVVVNRADDGAARQAFELLDEAARQFLAHPLRYAGAVPDDACLAVALRAGMPLQDAAAGSPGASAIAPIAERLAAASDRPPSPAARAGRPSPGAPAAAHSPARPAGALAAGAAARLAYAGASLGSAR